VLEQRLPLRANLFKQPTLKEAVGSIVADYSWTPVHSKDGDGSDSPQQGRLDVRLRRAEGLSKSDRSKGWRSVYAVVRCWAAQPPRDCRTAAAPGSPDPSWEESFSFMLPLQGPRPLGDLVGLARTSTPAGFGSDPNSDIYGPVKVEGSSPAGVLQLVVFAAYDLKNKDSGLYGNVSDPYVVVRVGDEVEQTPVIENDLTPVWTKDNRWVFNIHGGTGPLELEVMDSDDGGHPDSLGILRVPFWLQKGWARLRQPMEGGLSGQIEYGFSFEQASSSCVSSGSDQIAAASLHEVVEARGCKIRQLTNDVASLSESLRRIETAVSAVAGQSIADDVVCMRP